MNIVQNVKNYFSGSRLKIEILSANRLYPKNWGREIFSSIYSTNVQLNLLVQSQQHKDKKKVWNMFKVSNKKCKISTCFTPFSSVSVVDFEQVNVSWVMFWEHNIMI